MRWSLFDCVDRTPAEPDDAIQVEVAAGIADAFSDWKVPIEGSHRSCFDESITAHTQISRHSKSQTFLSFHIRFNKLKGKFLRKDFPGFCFRSSNFRKQTSTRYVSGICAIFHSTVKSFQREIQNFVSISPLSTKSGENKGTKRTAEFQCGWKNFPSKLEKQRSRLRKTEVKKASEELTRSAVQNIVKILKMLVDSCSSSTFSLRFQIASLSVRPSGTLFRRGILRVVRIGTGDRNRHSGHIAFELPAQ